MPWLFLPAFVLLTLDLPAFAGVRISLAILQIPLAAWLGARYGRAGAAVVATAAPLVLPRISFEFLSVGGEIGFWMASMATALISASPLPLAERLAPVRDRKRLLAAFVAAILFPIYFGPFEGGAVGEIGIAFGSSLWPAFYLLLFLLGARRAPWAIAIAIVAASAAAGWLLMLQGAFEIRGLSYGPVSPAAMTAALACFAVGRFVHRDLYGTAQETFPVRRPNAAIIGLMLLWAVPDSLSSIRVSLDDLRWLHLFGNYYLLPLACFFAGWARGLAGVRLAMGLTLALILLRHVADYLIEGSILLVLNVEWLFIPYCYGAVGMVARHGRQADASGIRWQRDALLIAAAIALPLTFELDTIEGALGALSFLAILLLGTAGRKHVRRLLDRLAAWARRLR